MNKGMYNANNGFIGNLNALKQPQTHTEGAHGIPPLDEDVYNLFNAWNFILPDNADDINNFIITLKAELGIQKLNDVFDCFYILAAATQSQSYINWAKPGTYDITYEGGTDLTFTTLKGWKASNNTATAYLNTNFNPYLTVCNFNNNTDIWTTGNTASLLNYGGAMGIYINEIPANTYNTVFVYDMGAHFGVNSYGNSISVLTTSNQGGIGVLTPSYQYAIFSIKINGDGIQNPMYGGITNASQLQHQYPPFYSVMRPDTSRMSVYTNGQFNFTANMAINVLGIASAPGPIIFPSINVSIAGTVSKYIIQGQPLRQYAFIYVGSKTIEQDILYKNINNYLNSIGAGVVNS